MVNISDEQLALLKDQGFLLRKKEITNQLISELARTEEALKVVINESYFDFPKGAYTKTGKISKGENYRDLPYLVLDFPRLFDKHDIFAFRTMIWWGHEISFTLHLQGKPFQLYQKLLIENLHLVASDIYVCINSTPWEYHYQEDNYVLSSMLSAAEKKTVLSADFLKISKKMDLDHCKEISKIAPKILKSYLDLIGKISS